ncbi:MAG: AAA family ATPase [Methyloceanibacter sp.]
MNKRTVPLSEIERLEEAKPKQKANGQEPPPNISATPYEWKDPTTLPRREWLHGRSLIRKFASGIIASGGVGKSSLVIGESLELVTGVALLTKHKAAPLRVWYWNGEDPYEEIMRRVQAACLHYNLSAEDIGDRLFVDSGRKMPIVIATEERGTLKVAVPVVEAVKRTIEENRIDVVRIDPFVRCHRVSENNNGMINAVTESWAAIADATGCAVELTHHIRKSGSGDTTVEDARVAGAFSDALRAVRMLNRMTQTEAESAQVTDRRLYFRLDDGKANLAPPAEASTWFHLQSVSLGNDMGGPADHVGVAVPWTFPSALEGVTVEDLRALWEMLRASRLASSVAASSA